MSTTDTPGRRLLALALVFVLVFGGMATAGYYTSAYLSDTETAAITFSVAGNAGNTDAGNTPGGTSTTGATDSSNASNGTESSGTNSTTEATRSDDTQNGTNGTGVNTTTTDVATGIRPIDQRSGARDGSQQDGTEFSGQAVGNGIAVGRAESQAT